MSNQQEVPKEPAVKSNIGDELKKMHQSQLHDAFLKTNQFRSEFLELFKPDNPRGESLKAFIQRNLRQQKLSSTEIVEVLGEVFTRGHKLTASGEVMIRNPAAWIRKTGLNCIRELGRKQRQFSSLDRDIPDRASGSFIDKLILEADLAILKRALQELTPNEQRLLKLKVVDELSWAEIKCIFASEGKTISEPTLRKQKERALKHLRQIYHGIKPLSEL